MFYRLGLNGHDGKPSLKRIGLLVTLVVMNGVFAAMSLRVIWKGQAFTETLAFFGLGVLAGAGGHYLISERAQLKDPLRTPPDAGRAPRPSGQEPAP
jgi:hypothetical protein